MKNKDTIIYVAIIYFFSWLMHVFAINIIEVIITKQYELFFLIIMLIFALVTGAYLFKNKALYSKMLWKPKLKTIKPIFQRLLIPTLKIVSLKI
jgi:hypothetical protein